MLKYEEGKLEANEYGARFPQRPYYPLLAANGTDAILLGLGGFPDDPNWMCYSAQLPFRINLGWYKTARKDYSYSHRHYGPSCYGTSVCLAGLTTILTVGKERNLGIRNPRQYFDPKKRILTTSFALRESRGKKTAEIKVTSFITDEHLLVERYEVLAEPENGIRFGFILDTPHSPDLYELCVHPEKIGHEKMGRGFCFRYEYSSPEIYDGELLKQPFMTAHASYVWAVNSLLVSRNGDRLAICANLPDKWSDLSFENLTTPDGLRVSAKLEHGKITELEIVNTNADKRDISLALPGQDETFFVLKNKDKYEIRIP